MKQDFEFIQSLGSEHILSITTTDQKSRLLNFVGFPEELSKIHDFAKIATAGRDFILHVIYIEHNFFRKYSIDQNVEFQLTHLDLFQSPRDINHFEKLGQQMGRQKFVSLCHKDGTFQPFDSLMIDLSSKTLDVLRYSCSLEPTFFHLHSGKTRLFFEGDDDFTTHLYTPTFRESLSGLRTTIVAEELSGEFGRFFVGCDCKSPRCIQTERHAEIQATN